MAKYVITRPAINRKDLTGKRFGTLVAIKYYASEITQYINGKRKLKACWLLKCDCGKEYIARANDLSDGKVKSCGCEKSKITIAHNIKFKTKEVHSGFSDVWQSYKCGAKKRDLPFELDKESFYKISQKNCHYCGKKPINFRQTRIKNKKQGYIFNGIDRVDSSKGYSIDNCVPCCTKCNRMKVDYNIDDFLLHIKKIYFYSFKKQSSLE